MAFKDLVIRSQLIPPRQPKGVLRRPRLETRLAEMAAAEAESFIGKPYVYQFEWDDAKIYCSELIYKAYQRGAGVMVGSRHRIRDLDWKPHEEYIRKQAGGDLPLDRSLITPAELVRSPFTTILYNNFPE